MKIKMSLKSAKRLGFSIKGYVFVKGKKTPVPVFEKRKQRAKKKSCKKNSVPLKEEGRIVRLDLSNLTKG
jgi:hypothetical protein